MVGSWERSEANFSNKQESVSSTVQYVVQYISFDSASAVDCSCNPNVVQVLPVRSTVYDVTRPPYCMIQSPSTWTPYSSTPFLYCWN